MNDPNTLKHIITVFDYRGFQIQDRITSMKYCMDEDGDDVCELTIESDKVDLADLPEYQDGRQLKLQWGWIGGKKSPFRKVWIWDSKDEYKEDGSCCLTLICHDLFSVAKMDLAVNKSLSQVKKGVPLIFSTSVIGNLALDIDAGNTDLANLLKESDINLHGTKGRDYGKGNVVVGYFNGNMSTFYGLRNYLDRLPGGPYVMDSRDDRVVIRGRNFQSKSKFTYAYKQEPAQLLEFPPETKNRHKKRSSEKVKVTTWDHDAKTAITVSAEAGKNTGVVLANGKSLDLSALTNLTGKPKGGNLSTLPFTRNGKVETPGSGLTQVNASNIDEIIPKPTPKPVEGGASHLLAQIRNASTHPNYSNPTNDLPNETVADKLIISKGQLSDGTQVDKLFLGQSSGVIRGTHESTARDATAVANQTYAIVKDEPGAARNLLSNDDLTRAKALAENTRKNAELANHPASARMMGEPQMGVADILTIKNVSIKHSGNYYVQKITHEINDNGYFNHVEKMVRNGHNHYVPAKGGSKDLLGTLIPKTQNFGDINPNDFQVVDNLIINVSQGPANTQTKTNQIIKTKTPDKS